MRWIDSFDSEKDCKNGNDDRQREKEVKNQKRRNDELA
jgi:hypothetical protein